MTSESFPEMNRKHLKLILRDGATLDGADDLLIEDAKKLEQLNLIHTKRRDYTLCVNQYDTDYHRLKHEARNCLGEIPTEQDECPVCGRQIENQNQKQRFTVFNVNISWEGIELYINNIFYSIPEVVSTISSDGGIYHITLNNGQSINLILLEPKTPMEGRYRGIYYSDNCIYIYCRIYDRPVTDILNEKMVMWLGDFLSQSCEDIASRLLIASGLAQNEHLLRYEEYDRLFEIYVTGVTWQNFEKQFVPKLINHIINNPLKLQDYLHHLHALNNTMLGSFPVSIGGAGKTDSRLIEKFSYMQTVFKPNNIMDAKRYHGRTQLRSADIIGVNDHLTMLGREANASAIIFTSTDNIHSTAWAKICEYKDTNGYWRIAIIPKPLILELLAFFDAIDLIK